MFRTWAARPVLFTSEPKMEGSRRQFIGWGAAFALECAARGVYSQPRYALLPEEKLSQDPARPQFHLVPARNWMNDPNGPIYYNGRYHMFFQYNPEAPVWGNMSWNHATSPDMLHWTHEPLALVESPGGPDADGCFSGSCIAADVDGHQRVYAIYTGVVLDPAHETIRNEGLRETQCLAWSDDASLVHWTKKPESMIASPPPGLAITGFRDPSVWKSGSWFYMTVGSGLSRKGGCVLLYKSRDLQAWEYLHVLAGGNWDGSPTSNPVGDGEMWECPEFFPLDGAHVLIYSTMGKVFWQTGLFDEAALTFQATRTGLLDLDAFYAPKTQLDEHGRRILWGWIPERRSKAAMMAAGWAGMMSLPRVLNVNADGSLRMQFLPEANILRKVSLRPEISREVTLPEPCGEILCTGEHNGDFTLTLAAGPITLLTVDYESATHTLRADGKSVVLKKASTPRIHGYVDGSVIEVILGEQIGYTKRFYLAPDVSMAVRASTKGTQATLQAWEVTPISPNRLTTPAPHA